MFVSDTHSLTHTHARIVDRSIYQSGKSTFLSFIKTLVPRFYTTYFHVPSSSKPKHFHITTFIKSPIDNDALLQHPPPPYPTLPLHNRNRQTRPLHPLRLRLPTPLPNRHWGPLPHRHWHRHRLPTLPHRRCSPFLYQSRRTNRVSNHVPASYDCDDDDAGYGHGYCACWWWEHGVCRHRYRDRGGRADGERGVGEEDGDEGVG